MQRVIASIRRNRERKRKKADDGSYDATKNIVPEEDTYSDDGVGSKNKQKKRKEGEKKYDSDNGNTISAIETFPITTPAKLVNSKKPILVEFFPEDLVTRESYMKVPFVNREKVAKELAKSLLTQKTTPKGMLPILSQHFGSGKTALVSNFRRVLTTGSNFTYSSLGDTEQNVKSLMQAALITVNVALEHDPDKKEYFFGRCLRIIHTTLENYDITSLNESDKEQFQMSLSMFNKEAPMSSEQQKMKASLDACDSIFQFLKQWSENKLFPLLMFFDELSNLKKEEIIEFWKRAQQLFGSFDENGNYIRYPGIFIVFGGKSAILSKLGRGFIVSPTPSIHLVLDMLKVEHIVTLLDETIISPYKDVTFRQLLEQKFKLGDFEYFCKVLHEYSGGIPRLIIKTMYSFVKNWCEDQVTEDLSSRESIVVLFSYFRTHKLFDEVNYLSEIRPLLIEEDHPAKTSLRSFYYFATTGIPVTPMDGVIDLIYDLNIGLENMLLNNEQYFRLIVPKFISLSETIAVPENVRVLQQIFSHGFSTSQIVDKGALLEVLVRDILISKIVFLIKDKKLNRGKWETVHPCFAKSTLLTDKIVCIDTEYVRYMPKIDTDSTVTTKSSKKYCGMTIPWDHAASDKDWKKLKEAFFIGNCIIHPAPKSRSSDFYLNLPPNYALAFAVKNYPNTTVTIQILQEEIDKCFLSTQENTFSKIALFVFCNGIEHSKLNGYCDNDGYLVLASGVYEFAKDNHFTKTKQNFKTSFTNLRTTPNNISKYSPPHHENKLYVPDDMEVIILGKIAFDSFFSEDDRSLLDSLSTNIPNYLEYLGNLPLI